MQLFYDLLTINIICSSSAGRFKKLNRPVVVCPCLMKQEAFISGCQVSLLRSARGATSATVNYECDAGAVAHRTGVT